jgi:hypothetical protein
MIALITCYFQRNYGSQLQAYATQKLLDGMGIPNETIRIDGFRKEITSRKLRYFRSRALHWSTWTDKWPVVRKILNRRFRNPQIRRNWSIRENNFARFVKDKIRLSQPYASMDELGLQPYQAFLVGSDQLWLPSNIEADYYTLNFAPDAVPKIAFSTSFGVDNLPLHQAQKASAFLSRLDDIMVREQRGCELVRELTGREAMLVSDPVLCLTREDWDKEIPKTRFHDHPYILCHFLGRRKENRRWAQQFKERMGLPVVMLPHCDDYVAMDEELADEKLYDVSPLDFVRLIRDAEYVLTDSYHCTAFSLLYQKHFFTFPRYSKEDITSTNGRLRSLLSEVGLTNRYLTGQENLESCLHQTINYVRAHEKLTLMRQASNHRLYTDLLFAYENKGNAHRAACGRP